MFLSTMFVLAAHCSDSFLRLWRVVNEDSRSGKAWNRMYSSEASWRKFYKARIMDMGITKGTDIFVVKVAPLGDPIELKVRGYDLSIRKSEAKLIEVDSLK